MRFSRLTEKESTDLVQYQFFSLGTGISRGDYRIEDLGDILPGSLMVQDVSVPKLVYMNKWGTDNLGYSLEELSEMNDEYYRKFFLDEEARIYLPGIIAEVKKQDPTSVFSFFQHVITDQKEDPGLYHTSCKVLTNHHSHRPSNKLILISNPVQGIGRTIDKLSKYLKEQDYASRNYKKFLLLTKREKEIITLLIEGKSSRDISDILYISSHTVNTHRKNIARKLNINSFAELIKFANAFDLIRY